MKGLFALISSILAFALNTCTSIGPTPEPSLPPCTWGSTELYFEQVKLSLPSCVNLGLGVDTLYDISEPFTMFVCGGPGNYGEFRWTSTNIECDASTKTRVTIFDTNDHNTYYNLWNACTPIDSALTVTGSHYFSVIGTASITINGVINYSTGETVALIWESPRYSGSNMFRDLKWIETAQVATVSSMGRVYVHNEYQ